MLHSSSSSILSAPPVYISLDSTIVFSSFFISVRFSSLSYFCSYLTLSPSFSLPSSLLPCLCVLRPFAFQRCYGNYQRLFYRRWTHARRTLRAGCTLTPWLDPRLCPGLATNSLPNWLFRAAVFISFMVIFMRLCYHWLAWPGLPLSLCACLCPRLSP